MLEHLIDGFTSANCWAHSRRDYSDALKALGKGNEKAIRQSTAYQALARISAIYKIEGGLKDLTPKERLRERQKSIKPLVEGWLDPSELDDLLPWSEQLPEICHKPERR